MSPPGPVGVGPSTSFRAASFPGSSFGEFFRIFRRTSTESAERKLKSLSPGIRSSRQQNAALHLISARYFLDQ